MFDLCAHIFWLVMATNSRGSHDLLCDKAHSSHAGLIHKNTTKNKVHPRFNQRIAKDNTLNVFFNITFIVVSLLFWY